MPRTALVVPVPEADGLVLDAPPGVPAHVTVLFPFAPLDDIDEGAIVDVLARFAPFDFELDRLEQWPEGIVWLHPEPSAPFNALTEAVWRRFPDHPPYDGAHDVLIPHLTISMTPVEVEVTLPIACRAREVRLLAEGEDGRWRTRRSFPLQGVA
jgi:hypothetical protein